MLESYCIVLNQTEAMLQAPISPSTRISKTIPVTVMVGTGVTLASDCLERYLSFMSV